MAKHKTKYSPTETIRAVKGLHRKKLYNMMDSREIAYEKVDNHRVIDVHELIRVFGNAFTPAETRETFRGNISKRTETPEKHTGNSALTHEVALLRERLADKDQVIEDKNRIIADLREERTDLRHDRDQWRSQAQRLLLTDQRDMKPPEQPVEAQSVSETALPSDPVTPTQRSVLAKYGVLVLIAVLLTLVTQTYQETIRTILHRKLGDATTETEPRNTTKQTETSVKRTDPPQQSFPPTQPFSSFY